MNHRKLLPTLFIILACIAGRASGAEEKLQNLRVEYAKLLLRSEEPSITYVAEASGFANANYFAKVFRRETGISPSEYIESLPRQEEKPFFCRDPFLW